MKKSIVIVTFILLFIAFIVACNTNVKNSSVDDLKELIPAWVKDSIYLSDENPYTTEKAKLGRYFFYDRRLSVNQTKSCASCHDQKFSFTDNYRRSIGALGDNVQHNAPALINIVFNRYLTIADSSMHFPEQQISNPMFHNQPVELGWQGNEQLILDCVKKDSFYNARLHLLFKDSSNPFSVENIQACISSFVKTILSFNSPYDRFAATKDSSALTASQLNGMKLFFSDRLHCSSCHGGINFSTPMLADKSGHKDYYQNTGLYNIDGKGAYPANDQGLFECTKAPADMGKYRIPTLRNLAFTAPYLHDGTAASLEGVINIYECGGRNITAAYNKGDGRTNPFKHPLIAGFTITGQERKDLINFLLSLGDSTVCSNPLYANPFVADETGKKP